MAAWRERYLKFAALIHRGMTGIEAARECGYKCPAQAGNRLLKNVHVCAEITRLRAEMVDKAHDVTTNAVLSAGEVLQKLTEIADDSEISAQVKIPALKLLGSHHRLFVERVEHTETKVATSVKKCADDDLAEEKARHLNAVK